MDQQLKIDRTNFLTDGFLQIIQRKYGACECKHAISKPHKGRKHTLKDQESEGATARLRNRK